MLRLQAEHLEEIQLTEANRTSRQPLSIILPSPPSQPADEGPTPLSSVGGRGSQGLTPPAGPGPNSDTALFYNGLFKNSFRRGLQGLLIRPKLTDFYSGKGFKQLS